MRCQDTCLVSDLLFITVPKGCGPAWSRAPEHRGPTLANASLTITLDVFSSSLSLSLSSLSLSSFSLVMVMHICCRKVGTYRK